MKRIKNVCLILISILCISCTDYTMYHSYHHFPKEKWSKSDTISLNLQVTDSIPSNYEIIFLVRNLCGYPYQNFSAMLQHNMPDSTSWKSYKINFTLADKNGRWKGAGWGGLYESSASLGKVYISTPKEYTFKISHQMSDESLQGISDVGVIIKKEVP